MGHRASVAYTDGERVRAHYSHWGAADIRLHGTFAERQPYAGGRVDQEPYWEGDSLEAWAREAVDYLHHEAAYVVNMDTWDDRAFATIRWLGDDKLFGEGTPGHHDKGALVEVSDVKEYNAVFGSEYDWEGESMHADALFDGEDGPVQQLEQIHRDAISEEAFAERVRDEFGDRLPTFSQYHSDD